MVCPERYALLTDRVWSYMDRATNIPNLYEARGAQAKPFLITPGKSKARSAQGKTHWTIFFCNFIFFFL
jgi:hypothetical protein